MPRRLDANNPAQTTEPGKKTGRNSPLFVNSMEKGFQVLKAFYQEHKPLSLNEITLITGLDKSAVQRFTHTLVTMGYLAKDKRTRQYYPASQLLDLSFMYLRSDPLVEIAARYLLDAHEESKEAVNLSRRADLDVIYLIRIPSRTGRLVPPLVGGRAPIYCTASGRAMLSAMQAADARAILDRCTLDALTTHTITERDTINQMIRHAQRDGYTIADQECLYGEITVAAPILDSHKQVIAAVNISVTTRKWNPESVERELAPIVVHTAHAISRAHGFPTHY